MKILLTIITVFILNSCFAQTNPLPGPPPNGSYIINNNLDKYQGTWRWTNGLDTVIIKIKKVKYSFKTYEEDMLLGAHEYKKNGVVLESSLEKFDSIINIKPDLYTVLFYNNLNSNPDKIKGFISNSSGKIRCRAQLTYIAGTVPQLTWKLQPLRDVVINPPAGYGITLPLQATFIKL